MLLSLVDGRLRLLEVRVCWPLVQDVEPGLVTFESLGRGGHLGGGTLDLGIQVSVGHRREVGLGYGLVLLRLDNLALRLLELRLKLGPLGVDAAAA